MPFDTGSISCRLYDIDESLDASVIEEFAVNVVAPIETLGAQPLSGWVSPRHLLDREITRESCLLGSFVRADLLKAELKIPRTLLKAYCKIEEIAEMICIPKGAEDTSFFAYRSSYYQKHISRSAAASLLGQIIKHRHNLVPVENLGVIPINHILESALEERFIAELAALTSEVPVEPAEAPEEAPDTTMAAE